MKTNRNYEPMCSVEGSEYNHPSYLALGVKGYAIQVGEEIYIPLIEAEREGSGAVGQFLDRISERCRVVNVTSARLEGMLRRRRFRKRIDEQGVDIWSPPA